MDSQDTSASLAPLGTSSSTTGSETSSAGQSFHSGGEKFEAPTSDAKGGDLAQADGELPPAKVSVEVGEVIDAGSSVGDEKDGVLGGADVMGREKIELDDGGGAKGEVFRSESLGFDEVGVDGIADDTGKKAPVSEGVGVEEGESVGGDMKSLELRADSGEAGKDEVVFFEASEGLIPEVGGGSGIEGVEESGPEKMEPLGSETSSVSESFHSGGEKFKAPTNDVKGGDLAQADGKLPPEKVGVEVGKIVDAGSSVGNEKDGVLGGGDVMGHEKIELDDGGGVQGEAFSSDSSGFDEVGVDGKADDTGKEAPVSEGAGVEEEKGESSVGDMKSLELRAENGEAGKDEAVFFEASEGLIPEVGGGSDGEGVEESGREKREPLGEPEKVLVDSVAADGGESVEDNVEQLGSVDKDSTLSGIDGGDSGPLGRDASDAGGSSEEKNVEEKVESLRSIADEPKLSGIVGMAQGDSCPDGQDVSIADRSSDEKDIDEEGDEGDAALDKDSSAMGTGDEEGEMGQVLEEVMYSQFADANLDEYLEENFDDEDIDFEELTNFEESEEDDVFGSSEVVKQLLKDLERGSPPASSGVGGSREFSLDVDGQIALYSDEEGGTDEESNGMEFVDSAALAALLRAAAGGSVDENITISSQNGSRIFTVNRPTGLGSSVPSLRSGPAGAARLVPPSNSDITATQEPDNDMDEEERVLHEKVDSIRVKFLRLVHRLGHSAEDTAAAQVLYRLGLAEGIKRGRQTRRVFGVESAKKKALTLEENEEPLEFCCTILVIGKTGVGKSSIINSILDEQIAQTDAFQPSTSCITEFAGTVDGVKIRFIDTPGLRPSIMEQNYNKKMLSSVKKYTKKCPPDIVLYVDRLDTQTRDLNDLPLLKSIASSLGASVWFNAIIALTHASAAPPDGPNGTTLGYEVFVAQRSHVVQHSIRQAVGDMRLMNPVALVENHSSCRRNRQGRRVLPNGTAWKSQLLLLCYSSKILSEASSLLKFKEPSPENLFRLYLRSPPLPYLLSSLLQSRAHPKLATDQGGDENDSDVDLGYLADSDEEEDKDEYDQLPPFKPLRKSEFAKLTKEHREAYLDEYDYRVKLLQKKQWREELTRLREMKKRRKKGRRATVMPDDYDQDAAAAVPVPLPDMVLPPTFDCNIPVYRYRFLEPTSQRLVRPVFDNHGWDHDCGYDGVSLEENLAIMGQFPGLVAVQITKDKKEFNLHLDSSVAAKHGENGSSLAGFDIQSVGKQLAYILRGETKFKNLKKNRTTAGITVTFLGENVITGLKLEDKVVIGKRLCLVGSTGAVRSQGIMAYGANLEACLRQKDYPIVQDTTTLGVSLMKWRRDLALGANLQSQFSIGRNSKVAVRLGLNNKRMGQFSIRTSTSDQLQIALLGVIPIAISIYRTIWPGEPH